MPPKPSWFMHLPEIINSLSELTIPVVDRAMCEQIFALKRRQTITLMQHFGGYRTGNTILLERLPLIAKLGQLQASPEMSWESKRKQSLAKALTEMEQAHVARAIQLPVNRDVRVQRASPLPAGILLERGRLTVNFTSAEDLFGRLFSLAQVALNDFEGLRAMAEPQACGKQ